MRAAVEEQHHAEARLAFSAAAVLMAVVLFGAETFGSKPESDGLAAELDGEFLGQGLGEVGEVEVEAVMLVDTYNLAAKVLWFGVGRGATAVAVAHASSASLLDRSLEAEDLAAAEAEHPGCGSGAEVGVDSLLDHVIASHVASGVVDGLWHASSITVPTAGV